MANENPKHLYEKARERLDNHRDEGNITPEEHDAIAEFCSAHDPNDLRYAASESLEYNTLKEYCSRLYRTANRTDWSLMDTTPAAINEHMTRLLDGSHPDIQDSGYVNGTVRFYQSVLRSFYQYHDDILDHTQIAMVDDDDPPITEDEMFTSDDIQAMRSAVTNVRDRCLLELFIYTGQRVRAIQTLRIKDISVDDGRYRLNPEVDGLKGAGGKRPLLGARPHVKDWLELHPTGEPDDYLLCPLHTHNDGSDPGSHIGTRQISRRLHTIGDRAGVDKPVNPHNFRHYFVTIAKRHYGMDNDVIRWLIGHREGSRVMETTYQHLTDEDRIKEAEIQAGYREREDDSPEAPDECPNCYRSLPADANICPQCGEQLTLGSDRAQEQIDELFEETMIDGTPQQRADAMELDELLDDPEVRDELIAKLLSE